jgi:hypothetical protein
MMTDNMSNIGYGREFGLRDLDLDPRSGTLSGGESRGTEYTGTKALMLAVLEDGIRSYLSPVGRIRSEAEYWVTAKKQRSPFSFTVVCDTLGLEAEAVREALEKMRSKNVAPRSAIRRSRPNVRRNGRMRTKKHD